MHNKIVYLNNIQDASNNTFKNFRKKAFKIGTWNGLKNTEKIAEKNSKKRLTRVRVGGKIVKLSQNRSQEVLTPKAPKRQSQCKNKCK